MVLDFLVGFYRYICFILVEKRSQHIVSSALIAVDILQRDPVSAIKSTLVQSLCVFVCCDLFICFCVICLFVFARFACIVLFTVVVIEKQDGCEAVCNVCTMDV